MIQRHTSGFRAAELRENGADSDIVDACGVEIGVSGDSGFQNLRMDFSILALRLG